GAPVRGRLMAAVRRNVPGHVGLVRRAGRRRTAPRGGRGGGGGPGRRRGSGRRRRRRGHRRALGEGDGVGGEVPRVLRHTAALAGGGAVVVRRVALPVPVHRPEREPAQPVRLREAEHGGEIALVEVLAGVGAPIHAGEALVRISLGTGPAERAHQLRVEVL